MTEADLVAWFKDVLDRAGRITRDRDGYYNEGQAAGWIADAQAALAAVFPPKHVVMVRFGEAYAHQVRQKVGIPHSLAFELCVATFEAAARMLDQGRLQSLLDGIRAETVSELLDQADGLVSKGHVVAAAVVAGGALETHLLHLCTRHGLVPSGEGSISKYDGAIAQARNSGQVEVYSAGYTKQVKAWGDIRNDAAHTPTTFKWTAEEVKRMVAGVREFVLRVP